VPAGSSAVAGDSRLAISFQEWLQLRMIRITHPILDAGCRMILPIQRTGTPTYFSGCMVARFLVRRVLGEALYRYSLEPRHHALLFILEREYGQSVYQSF